MATPNSSLEANQGVKSLVRKWENTCSNSLSQNKTPLFPGRSFKTAPSTVYANNSKGSGENFGAKRRGERILDEHEHTETTAESTTSSFHSLHNQESKSRMESSKMSQQRARAATCSERLHFSDHEAIRNKKLAMYSRRKKRLGQREEVGIRDVPSEKKQSPISGISGVVEDNFTRSKLSAPSQQNAGKKTLNYIETAGYSPSHSRPLSPYSLSSDDEILMSDVSSFECASEDTDTSGWSGSSSDSDFDSLMSSELEDGDTLTSCSLTGSRCATCNDSINDSSFASHMTQESNIEDARYSKMPSSLLKDNTQRLNRSSLRKLDESYSAAEAIPPKNKHTFAKSTADAKTSSSNNINNTCPKETNCTRDAEPPVTITRGGAILVEESQLESSTSDDRSKRIAGKSSLLSAVHDDVVVSVSDRATSEFSVQSFTSGTRSSVRSASLYDLAEQLSSRLARNEAGKVHKNKMLYMPRLCGDPIGKNHTGEQDQWSDNSSVRSVDLNDSKNSAILGADKNTCPEGRCIIADNASVSPSKSLAKQRCRWIAACIAIASTLFLAIGFVYYGYTIIKKTSGSNDIAQPISPKVTTEKKAEITLPTSNPTDQAVVDSAPLSIFPGSTNTLLEEDSIANALSTTQSNHPSAHPSLRPSSAPSLFPSLFPVRAPIMMPSATPSTTSSLAPSLVGSTVPPLAPITRSSRPGLIRSSQDKGGQ